MSLLLINYMCSELCPTVFNDENDNIVVKPHRCNNNTEKMGEEGGLKPIKVYIRK